MSATATALRLIRAKQRRGEVLTVGDAWNCCPFRTLLCLTGSGGMDPPASTIVLIEDTPSPIDPETMGEIQQDLAAGRTVLLLASDRIVRDTAKMKIMALAGPARGQA